MRVTITSEPESPNDALALAVRMLRELRGESQSELAARVGWSQSRVSALEKGQRAWDVCALWTIAEAFDLPPSDLVRRAGKLFSSPKDRATRPRGRARRARRSRGAVAQRGA